MKRIISIFLTAIVFCTCSFNSFAWSKQTNTSIEYFEDGSYIITTIQENANHTTFSTSTKTGSKRSDYYNEDSEIMWSTTLTATFSYSGTSATCTASNITYTVNASNWRIISAVATKSGNMAIGDVTAKKYFLGVPIETVERTVTLTCSPTGVLS